jgi:hypothetical protein
MPAHDGDGMIHFGAGNAVALEVDSAETIDLKIKPAEGGEGG